MAAAPSKDLRNDLRNEPIAQPEELTAGQFEALAEFRYRIRRFLRFAESQARKHGIQPQQYQLMLAVKALNGIKPTVTLLAEKLQLAHHSTVELLDRIERQALIVRERDTEDGRVALVRLTPKGDRIVCDIAAANTAKLQVEGRAAMKALRATLASYNEASQGIVARSSAKKLRTSASE